MLTVSLLKHKEKLKMKMVQKLPKVFLLDSHYHIVTLQSLALK